MDRAGLKRWMAARGSPGHPRVTAKLSGRWAEDALDLMAKIEVGIFRWKLEELPALGIPEGWANEMHARLCSSIAQGNAWLAARRKRRNRIRAKRRREGPYDPRIG